MHYVLSLRISEENLSFSTVIKLNLKRIMRNLFSVDGLLFIYIFIYLTVDINVILIKTIIITIITVIINNLLYKNNTF